MNYFLKITDKVSFADISLLFLAKRNHGELITFDKQLNKIAKKIN